MKSSIIPSYKFLYAGVLLIGLFSINVLSVMVIAQSDADISINGNSESIRLVQTRLDNFGGVNSIMARTSTSALGVIFGTTSNAFPLSIFTDFTQKLAEIEFQNQQGTITNRTQLMTRNTFLVKLVRIIEYDSEGTDSRFNSSISPSIKKVIDLSATTFHINASRSSSNESATQLSYHLDFFANNLTYLPYRYVNSSLRLDSLVFSIDFDVEKTQVIVPTIPKIKIRSDGTSFTVTPTTSSQTIEAIRFAPRLKFSCNINGWDFSTSNSNLILHVEFYAHEEILGLSSRIGDLNQTREVLKKSDLLGEFKFSTLLNGQPQSHILDQSTAQTVNYTARSFNNNRFSLGNSFRDFLNFTWAQNVSVDGVDKDVVFQPLSSGESSLALRPSIGPLTQTLFLSGGFIFPQGNEIYYDPEIIVEELNPIFNILPAPNRVILESSSQIILFTGFFVGIIIVIRQRFYK
ncbi:hypothetical protein CEE45_11260 [Candidatus Heimdallarchaeota archaeon B3_Heim]|nr:MAG: hypothetical protein CEE45_11260 [Candidatus Heimdallarchaeota archaeon B3_Heim]